MKRDFSGWREGLRFYGPVLAAGVVLTGVLWPMGWGWLGIVVLLLGLAMLAFFRDFPRKIAAAPSEVVSPADGTVVGIEDIEETTHYNGPCRRVSIFLSVLDVHVNRAPFDCTVSEVRYTAGRYLDARKSESSKVNESNALWLETERGPMTVRQISGAVARRIVCPVGTGARLEKGQRFGMIRFGSRTELYLPPGTEICAKMGDKVRGGITILARFS